MKFPSKEIQFCPRCGEPSGHIGNNRHWCDTCRIAFVVNQAVTPINYDSPKELDADQKQSERAVPLHFHGGPLDGATWYMRSVPATRDDLMMIAFIRSDGTLSETYTSNAPFGFYNTHDIHMWNPNTPSQHEGQKP